MLRPNQRTLIAFVTLRSFPIILDYGKGFLLPVLVFKQSGGSTFAVGIAFAIEFLPRAILAPLFGSAIDRQSGKTLVIATEIARFAVMLLWLLMSGHRLAWMASSLVSLLSGLSLVYYEAAASGRLDAQNQQSFHTITQLFEPFARLAGPGIVGLLLLFLSPVAVLDCTTAGYGIAALLSLKWKAITTKEASSDVEPWSIRVEVHRWAMLGRNLRLLWLTLAAGFLNAFFGIFQALLIPTMMGRYRLPDSMAALPNVVGGAVSFLMAVTLLRRAKNQHITRFGFLGASSLAIAGALAASDIGILGFSLAFGFLVLGSALYGVYFRNRRIQLIPAHQLAQGIGATVAILTLFLPLAGAISAMTSTLSPLMVIGFSGIVSALVLLTELIVTSKSGRVNQSFLDIR